MYRYLKALIEGRLYAKIAKGSWLRFFQIPIKTRYFAASGYVRRALVGFHHMVMPIYDLKLWW